MRRRVTVLVKTHTTFLINVVVYSATAVAAWAGYSWFPSPKSEPLFTGGPQLVILSLVVAIGLYLRQVYVYGLELRDDVLSGKIWTSPSEKKYAPEKTKQLQQTSDIIALVTPFLIIFTLIIGVRILLDDIGRFYWNPGEHPRFLYAFDFVIALGLLGTLMGLAAGHFISRSGDRKIRRLIERDEHEKSQPS